MDVSARLLAQEGQRILIAPMLAREFRALERSSGRIQAGGLLQGPAQAAGRMQGHVAGHTDAIA